MPKVNISTQRYLSFSEIREDCAVLKDGTLRVALLVSSINFALKSEDEQNAIVQGYVNFLNSFDFPLQIVIQSRKLNINPYLEKLKIIEKQQTNELLKNQISEYRSYVNELVKIGQIMTKRFYLVVPYNPLSDKKKGFFGKIIELFRPGAFLKLNKDVFEKRRRELFQRVDHVVGGLNSMGLQAVPLDTQALIELYYNTYNPDMSEVQKLPDIGLLRVEE